MVLVFIEPLLLFILPSLCIILWFLWSVPDIVPDMLSWRLLSTRCMLVEGSPALGMLDGLPVWAPGAVPGATVWAVAAVVARAKARARREVAFIGNRESG